MLANKLTLEIPIIKQPTKTTVIYLSSFLLQASLTHSENDWFVLTLSSSIFLGGNLRSGSAFL